MIRAIVIVALLGGCGEPPPPCAEWKDVEVVTYPFIGMIGSNVALALTPTFSTERQCVRRCSDATPCAPEKKP